MATIKYPILTWGCVSIEKIGNPENDDETHCLVSHDLQTVVATGNEQEMRMLAPSATTSRDDFDALLWE